MADIDKPIEITSREDLEQFRTIYEKLGGCKLVHHSQIDQDFFDSQYIDHVTSWLNNDNPLAVNIDRVIDKSEGYSLYTFAKFLWLAEDLRKNEQLVYPQGYIKDGKIVIHPGSVKVAVMDYLEMDYEVILWDSKGLYNNIPRLTFDEWCDLVPIDGTQIYVCDNRLEIWVRGGFRKDIYKWYYNFQLEVQNKVMLYIGVDPKHSHSAEKCVKSIRRYNKSIRIEFINTNDIKEYTRPWGKQTTAFTYSRFLVPWLMNYEGIGIFCDDDFVWNCDPLEILYSLETDKAVSCVQHNFTKDLSGTKLGDQPNVMYPKKLWSSMMMFNNAHPDCKNLTPDAVNTKSGQWLHQFKWSTNIGEIPQTYNWCEGSSDYCTKARVPMIDAKVWHFTRGGPWIDHSADWSHIHLVDQWERL